MSTILVVDDERSVRDSLEMILAYEKYEVCKAANGKEALAILQKGESVDVALVDIKMPGMDGIELLEKIKASFGDVEVVIISGHADIQTAVEAVKKGAYDFLAKPLDQDRVLITIHNVLKAKKLHSQYENLKKMVSQERQLLGQSQVMVQILNTIKRVAPTEARVLITGENGTGKELVAKAVHESSPRNNAAFVEVNCAAIPENLIESELFGHEKGSFTGASEKRKGKFEMANQGTIFLDEIGDMSLAAQAKVLRVLEESKIDRVGGDSSLNIDVRVIAATNKNLREECAAGKFREDLFYRLNVVPIQLPPLRERQNDVPLLVSHFLVYFSHKYSVAIKKISPDAMHELQHYPWPGNVRELRNLMERLVILCATDIVSSEDIKNYLPAPSLKIEGLASNCQLFEDFKRESEKLFIFHKLVENNWNVKKTAEKTDMQRSNLYKKIEKYGLYKPGSEGLIDNGANEEADATGEGEDGD
jgi:two-component system nitrogen regulation response regulator NtrX